MSGRQYSICVDPGFRREVILVICIWCHSFFIANSSHECEWNFKGKRVCVWTPGTLKFLAGCPYGNSKNLNICSLFLDLTSENTLPHSTLANKLPGQYQHLHYCYNDHFQHFVSCLQTSVPAEILNQLPIYLVFTNLPHWNCQPTGPFTICPFLYLIEFFKC